MATKTKTPKVTPSDAGKPDNAPDMGTTGADPITGLKLNPATGQLEVADPGIANATKGQNQIAPDVNDILAPYLKELQNLGPEYQQEMDYLKPYLEGTGAGAPESFAQLRAGSQADESATGSKAVNAADQAAGTALENQQPPGFGNLAQAAGEFAGTVPYSQILQTVLGAGKNEILYGTIPNISNISTKGWPQSLQDAYSFLTQSATGTNPSTGLNAPQVAARTAPNPNQPQAGPNSNLSGGGNAG